MKLKNKQMTVSSLDKVFPYEGPKMPLSKYSVFKNETFHFQVACFADWLYLKTQITIESDLGDAVSIRAVEHIPSHSAGRMGEGDTYRLRVKGDYQMYPDLLRPLYEEGEALRKGSWTTFWVTVDGRRGLPVGEHKIKIKTYKTYKPVDDLTFDEESVFTLKVIDAELPPSDLTYTCWMHYDCISQIHGIEMWSEDFYQMLGEYISSAVKHGMTMLYTPLFTPALDTAVGSYRQTAQLIKVKKDKNGYAFDFSEVLKFMRFAREKGIKQFELCHFATQWGAEFCPKVMASVDGKEERIFGWDTRSDSVEYLEFLEQMLSNLSTVLQDSGFIDDVYFHISDETPPKSVDKFLAIKKVIDKHFQRAKIMDATSWKSMYESGALTHPVMGIGNEWRQDWVYYASGGRAKKHTPNRSFAMPSQRNRVLGTLMYRNSNHGFLHWGFNFYHCAESFRLLNPYFQTDAGGSFDSGDAFLVYPAKAGVYESIRHEVLANGFTDYRALQLLESFVGREETLRFLKKCGVKVGYCFAYPTKKYWLEKFRLQVNEYIERILTRN